LIYFGAREAKGHGVPEVMLAVERNGGRIRPRVAAVKAMASAITISSGGSVGREGPIVQVASAVASTIGQIFRLPDDSVRLLVAAGAAGGISATFNAPIVGVFFALEIILRPGAVAPSGAYATVGMAAVFAGGARAPMTAILILFELTRDYSIILPLMTAVVTATALSRAFMRDSIYSLKLRRRGILLPESRQAPVLSAVPVGTAMRANPVTLLASAPARDLVAAFGTNGSRQPALVVLDDDGRIAGIATTGDFQRVLE